MLLDSEKENRRKVKDIFEVRDEQEKRKKTIQTTSETMGFDEYERWLYRKGLY